ncbi:hypothetical protein BDD12DRAFT_37468 [Trichophaea hybrida]|nr:hypothetical protein BDD12DRAFT_37468 [Trichophaea hybrida]
MRKPTQEPIRACVAQSLCHDPPVIPPTSIPYSTLCSLVSSSNKVTERPLCRGLR